MEAVRDIPRLLQVSSMSYKDLRAKENAWKAVASKVSVLELENGAYEHSSLPSVEVGISK